MDVKTCLDCTATDVLIDFSSNIGNCIPVVDDAQFYNCASASILESAENQVAGSDDEGFAALVTTIVAASSDLAEIQKQVNRMLSAEPPVGCGREASCPKADELLRLYSSTVGVLQGIVEVHNT